MASLSVVGEYQILGRCQDIDGVQVYAARKSTEPKSEISLLHHFPIVSRSGEKQLRLLAEKTRTLDDPILVVPREIVRSPDGLFVVTDFVAGETIEQIVKSHREAISKVLAVAIGRDVARAVERLRQRTAGILFGDVTSAQVLVSYDSGQLKLIVVGAALVRGRSVVPSTANIGEVLFEMLAGKKPHGAHGTPNATADLDRIVSSAISSASSEIGQFGEELHTYLQTRTISPDRSSDLAKLIQQRFSHKANAMHSLVERWRSHGALPRSSSAPPRAPSVPPRAPSVSPRAPSVPPRRSSSIRRGIEVRPEAALAEPEIAILEPVELVPTQDMSNPALRPKPSRGWPRTRLAFYVLLLVLSLATVALVLLNGEGSTILSGWRALLASAQYTLQTILTAR